MSADYQYEIIEAQDAVELYRKYKALVASEKESAHGHPGYTGTFAEKPELKVIHVIPLLSTDEMSAEKHCQEHNEKWGPAFAYRLGANRWYIGGWCSL